MQLEISFDNLENADLYLDAVYLSGNYNNLKGEPLSKLLGLPNLGGFRYKISNINKNVVVCALVTSLNDPDWPDSLDVEQGLFTYYGDNKKAGGDLNNSKGNRILIEAFKNLHLGTKESRLKIPVFLVFTKSGTRDYCFRGMAVPGADSLTQTEDLVAVWKTDINGQRFQNYKATFTIVSDLKIYKNWINDIYAIGNTVNEKSPESWINFVNTGKVITLKSPRSIKIRNKFDQLPQTDLENDVLGEVIKYYSEKNNGANKGAFLFERCAAEICKMSDSKILNIDLTPMTRDGGRDGVGKYRIGTPNSYILVDFFVEAKFYNTENGNGVHLTSRLISRLRHRQFGYFVTTSYVSQQAYQEIVDDEHPVVIYSGRDIANILIEHGINSTFKTREWLNKLMA